MSNSSPKTYFMNGIPELLILRELSEKEMYGYELTRAIKSRTKDAVFLSEGGLYPLLHALERKKWLKSRRAMADGRPRVYYSITPTGRKRLTTISQRWESLATTVRLAVGADHEPGTV